MAKGDDIEERLINFAVRIINLTSHLPPTPAGRHFGDELLRCGTSPAAHYGEARGAESRRDFVHKLKICLKELNESRIRLTIVERSELLPSERMQDIKTECEELCRIIGTSVRTALTTKPT